MNPPIIRFSQKWEFKNFTRTLNSITNTWTISSAKEINFPVPHSSSSTSAESGPLGPSTINPSYNPRFTFFPVLFSMVARINSMVQTSKNERTCIILLNNSCTETCMAWMRISSFHQLGKSLLFSQGRSLLWIVDPCTQEHKSRLLSSAKRRESPSTCIGYHLLALLQQVHTLSHFLKNKNFLIEESQAIESWRKANLALCLWSSHAIRLP